MERIINKTEENKKKNLLKPKIDVVFHSLFREENKKLLESLISAALKEKVKVITTDKNRYLETKDVNEKLGILDLRVELEDSKQCLVELQLEPCKNENDRFLYYWANSYARQVKRGDKFYNLNKTISLIIVDHEIPELKGMEKPGVKWQIRDDCGGKQVLTEKLEIVIIEIPKAIRNYSKNSENPIIQWMMFFDNPNNKEVSKIMEKNKDIKVAKEELYKISNDDELRKIAELREKAIRDENATLAYYKEEGLKEGLKEGLEKGIEQGIEQGKKQGIQEAKIEIIKRMIKANMKIEQIMELTNFTKEEIEKYANS